MNYTRLEKEAINCLLIKLMKADGHTDLKEAAALFQISKSIGITINEAEDSLKMTFEEAKQILNSLDDKKKEVIMQLFDDMVLSDGYISPEEKGLLDSIFP